MGNLAASGTVVGAVAAVGAAVLDLGPPATLALDLFVVIREGTGQQTFHIHEARAKDALVDGGEEEIARINVQRRCGRSRRSGGPRWRTCRGCWCGAGHRRSRRRRRRGPGARGRPRR